MSSISDSMGYVMREVVGWMQAEGRQTDSLSVLVRGIGRLVSSEVASSRTASSITVSVCVRVCLCVRVYVCSLVDELARDRSGLSWPWPGLLFRWLVMGGSVGGDGLILKRTQSRLNGPSFAAPIQGPVRLVQAPRC